MNPFWLMLYFFKVAFVLLDLFAQENLKMKERKGECKSYMDFFHVYYLTSLMVELNMGLFHESMNEYKRQLEKGAIQEAYRGLMDYFNALRVYFEKKYPDHSVSGSVYYGYVDMTYFAIFPKSFKRRKLKVGIVFLHEAFRFEVWLFGNNKNVQAKYWKLFKHVFYIK